jgi:hypothetical protein
MQQRQYAEDVDPSFAASLRQFERLTLEEQLPILAFLLRDELNAAARARPHTKKSSHAVRSLPAARAQAPAPTALTAPLPEPAAPAAADPEPASLPLVAPAPPPASTAASMAPLVPATPLATTAKLQIIESDLLQDLSGNRTQGPAKKKRSARVPEIAAAANPRAFSIAATMAISFPLALALMLWQRPAATRLSDVQWSPMQQAFAVAPGITQNRPTAQLTAASSTPAPPPSATPVAQNAANARTRDPSNMPVTLYFRRRGFHSDPNDRRKINWYMEGRLTNLSDIPMNIEVRAESASGFGASQIQIDVEPHNERDFGVDDGLEMHPGDKVILMSAPYSDLVVGGVH